MSNEKVRPWHKNPAIMIPIIVAIIGAIGVVFAAYIGVIFEGPELSTVQGIVTDKDGIPVAGAVVEIDGFSTTTDSSGVYVIRDVSIGTKTITVRAPGAEVVRRPLRIPKGGEIIIYDFVLPPPAPTITPTPTPIPILTPTPTPTPFTPLYVPEAYYPSGWMGDWGDITLDDSYTDNPHSDPICIKIIYSAAKSQEEGWAGIYWQHPDSNWGDKIGGYDLTGATKLTFWARGEKGGEKAEFKVGGITGKYPDSLRPPVSTGVVILSDNWQQYTIDLTGKDLSHIIGGFVWVTNKNRNPYGCTIYLDDIRYE